MKLLRLTTATAAALLVAATLSACGSDDPEPAAAVTDPGGGGAATYGGGGPVGGGSGMPGASGEIAAVSGKTLQVQSESGQVSVTRTGTTEISQQVEAALADVTVGSCVMVSGADSGEGDSTQVDATELTAATVRVTEPVDGSCQGGLGARGTPPSGAPTDRPTDVPTNMPSGAPDGGRGPGGPGGIAFGEVTAVTGTGFTVESAAQGDQTARSVAVTVSGETTYTANATAGADALTVGRCVTATGDADETGAVTATLISVSDPVDGACQQLGARMGGGPA